jgi:hypothetical protein
VLCCVPPGDVRLLVLRPAANQPGLQQLRALQDLLAQLQQVGRGGVAGYPGCEPWVSKRTRYWLHSKHTEISSC